MKTRILLIGLGVLLLLVAGVLLSIPPLARRYARAQLERMARSRDMELLTADIEITWKNITVKNLRVKSGDFRAFVREVTLPDWKITRFTTPSIRTGEILVEGVLLDGTIPENLKRTATEPGGIQRIQWDRIKVRGIGLNLETGRLALHVRDGNWTYSREDGGTLELTELRLKSPWLPVYYIDAASVRTHGISEIRTVELSGLVWPFSDDFRLYTRQAVIKPRGTDTLVFQLEGQFLPDRGKVHAEGIYERKNDLLKANLIMRDAWAGLLVPPRVPLTDPQKVRFSGDVDLVRQHGKTSINASGNVSDVNIFDPRIAPEPLEGLSAGFTMYARHDKQTGLIEIPELDFTHKVLRARSAFMLKPDPQTGKYLVEAQLSVPKTPCADVAASLPAPLVPNIRQLELGGQFEAALRVNVDFAKLDTENATIRGRVNLDGCKVLKAPPHLRPNRLRHDFGYSIVEPGGQRVQVEVASDGEWTRQLDEISPHMVAAVLTTEDGSFWRHRGFITSEFSTALTQNLRAGRFKFGASSITMQIVKNVFFERRKTLSRKFEELFFTWHVEQVVPKKRLMEIYLNIIELGPGIYGVPRAAHHFFNKDPMDLTVRESIYLASLLPSPKRRYSFYCNQEVSRSWERMLDRLLAIMRRRNRITAEEYEEARTQTIVFDPVEFPGKESCLRTIRRYNEPPPKK